MTEELKKKVWAFSLPMISELFVQQLYSVIDMAIIGRYLGARELGAVGQRGQYHHAFPGCLRRL